jgi:hypothetical protein
MTPNPSQTEWPKTIVLRGSRPGPRPDYIWWQELPDGESADGLRSVGYRVVTVVPRHSTDELVGGLEAEIERLRAKSKRNAALIHLEYADRLEALLSKHRATGGEK